MARKPSTPAETVAREADFLAHLVRGLLIDNKNLHSPDGTTPPLYFSATPNTADFVREHLSDWAEYILERIGQSKQILVAMAADPDLPVGMKKSYSGVLHGRSVEASPTENGAWVMDIAIPGAFDDSGDFCGEVASESQVIALIGQFADTERIPDALSPAEEFRFRDNPHD